MGQEIITLRDEQRGSEAKILASYGFNCFSFRPMVQEQPIEVLWAMPGFESGTLPAAKSGIPILFPFPGRLRGTELKYGGRTYHLEPWEDGNAIHGFVLNRPWRVLQRSEKEVTGQFQASVDDPSVLERWPADFRITAGYTLAGNRLAASIRIENPGDRELPFALGTHPYFRVPIGPNSDPSQCVVTVPAAQYWEREGALPTGKKLPASSKGNLAAGMKFSEMKLDDAFTDLQFEDGQCVTSIVDASNAHTLVMSFGSEFRNCVVFNPPHREAVSIEPYTAAPDSINLADRGIDAGLRKLQPGETFESTVEIRLDQRIGGPDIP